MSEAKGNQEQGVVIEKRPNLRICNTVDSLQVTARDGKGNTMDFVVEEPERSEFIRAVSNLCGGAKS
jgi:hypothetical protein